MPHISRHPIKKETRKKLTEHVVSFLADTHATRRKKIFCELLTRTERVMIAKRLSMIYLINKGFPTHEISRLLRVSPSTVARFEMKVEKDLYEHTIQWLRSGRPLHPVIELLGEFLVTPFEAQKKSFAQRLRELDEKRWG